VTLINSYIASKFMIIGFFVSLILLFPLLADHEQERNNSHMQFECNTEQKNIRIEYSRRMNTYSSDNAELINFFDK